MRLDVSSILRDLEEHGFTYTWAKYSRMIPERGGFRLPARRGRPHRLIEVMLRVRRVLLDMGFDEVVNPMLIDSSEVYRQYGPEAPVILDRVYFLAGLPRPDIGLSKETMELIRREVGEVDVQALQEALREYKEGLVSADDLVSVLKSRLGIGDEGALKLIDIFRPFLELRPQPSSLTLRSHMTAAWFSTIASVLELRDPPIMMFSIDWVFRREQRVDESHLRCYHSASLVVVDEGLGAEEAVGIAREVFRRLGFPEPRIVLREDTARYYALGREWEVYLELAGRGYEVATFGLYSPVALARYGIPYPVFNMGIGLERLAQVLTGVEDVRKLVYPYRYQELSDDEIASMLRPVKAPVTEEGRRIEEVLVRAFEEYRDRVGPFKEKVYEGSVTIYLYEPDPKPYAGKAAFNRIYVVDGNIVSSVDEIPGGVYVARYADLIAKRMAAEVEEGRRGWLRVRWVERPSDVNLSIPLKLLKYLNERGKRIDIGGPVFIDILVE